MLDESARLALAGNRFAEVLWYPEVDSTNRALADLARHGAPDGLVLVADHQTAGRGRRGRRWEAPPGSSLLLSVLLRPGQGTAEARLATLLVALAAAGACQDAAGVVPLLKWPNDLVVGARKLGGILAETVPGTAGPAVVVGIGLNVNWPGPPPDGGTALDEVAGYPVDRATLLVALLRNLDDRCRRLREPDGAGQLLADYRAACTTLGRLVRVDLGGGALVEGRAAGVTGDGHLEVEEREEGGTRRVVPAGDVVHLRPL